MKDQPGRARDEGWTAVPEAPRRTKAYCAGYQGENPRDEPETKGADKGERQLGNSLKPHAAEVFQLKIGKAPDGSPEQTGKANRAAHAVCNIR